MKIPGLSKKQVAICDELWQLYTDDELREYLNSKIAKERQEIEIMIELMKSYYVDECCTSHHDCKEARGMIEMIMEKSK